VRYLDTQSGLPRIGLAYGTGVPGFVASNPGAVDYIEIPFEQLRHAPRLAALQEEVPLLLHCASMSIAGFVPPSDDTIDAIGREAERTRSPWIGEHLAFVTADGLSDEGSAPAPPTGLTYTVCPQLSEETIERVIENLAALRPRVPVPLILENSPQYFAVPGSTMSMADFIAAVLARTDVGMLLDLTHFLITCTNTGVDPEAALDRLPLERVVEIHVSGMSTQSGVAWDDHATPAPPAVFALLERALARARPRALTIEYNWSPTFPHAILLAHLGRARTLVGAA
jgi:uncharacterized protein